MNNLVAKHSYTFNKPKIQPNKKKINLKEYYLDDEDEYSIEYVSPEGEPKFEILTNITDKDITKVRKELMDMDCTFIKIYKNYEEIL